MNYLVILHLHQLKELLKVIWFKLCPLATQVTIQLFYIFKWENGIRHNFQFIKYIEPLFLLKKYWHWKSLKPNVGNVFKNFRNPVHLIEQVLKPRKFRKKGVLLRTPPTQINFNFENWKPLKSYHGHVSP